MRPFDSLRQPWLTRGGPFDSKWQTRRAQGRPFGSIGPPVARGPGQARTAAGIVNRVDVRPGASVPAHVSNTDLIIGGYGIHHLFVVWSS